jgi:tetratricopeptide (TPR) repeat protein
MSKHVNAQIRQWCLQTAVDAAGELVRQERGDELKAAHLHNQVRSALGEFGDIDKAPSHYELALAIYLKTLGNNHLLTATAYSNIGLVSYTTGDNDKALKYYEQALAISLTTVGDNHPLTATSHSNIVKVYEGKHNYTNTLKNYERALAIHLMVCLVTTILTPERLPLIFRVAVSFRQVIVPLGMTMIFQLFLL